MTSPGLLLTCMGRKIEATDGLIGKSDPFLVIYESDGLNPIGAPIWKTEAIQNTRKPAWDPFPFYYDLVHGDMNRPIVVKLYDYESHGDHEFIAQFNCTAAEFCTPGKEFMFFNKKKKKKKFGYKNSGYLSVTNAVALDQGNDVWGGSGYLTAPNFAITFKGTDLDKKDVLGKSDPYLIIKAHPTNADGSKRTPYIIARSEIIRNTLKPVWEPVQIQSSYCHPLDPLIITVYDYDSDLNNDLIGKTASTTLHELRMGKIRMPLVNQKKVGNVGYKNSGFLEVEHFMYDYTPAPQYQSFTISLSAKKLARRDTFGDPDPYLSLKAVPFHYISFPGHPHLEAMHPDQLPPEHRPLPTEVYRSEAYKNVKKPNFLEFTINVFEVGGMTGNISLELWDLDVKSEDDLIGKTTTNLVELMTPNLELGTKSPGKNHHGCQGIVIVNSITPSIDPAYSTFPIGEAYSIKFRGEKIARMDSGLNKSSRNSDPYLIFVGMPYGAWDLVEIARTDHIDSERNPEWLHMVFYTAQCGGLDTPVRITCMDYDRKSKDDEIGSCTLTLRQMHRLFELHQGVPLLRQNSNRKKNYGVLHIDHFSLA